MQRIILHWTAGLNVASALDREHYHWLRQGDGKKIWGFLPVEANLNTADGEYAAHTFMCNRNSIGAALCGMAGAIEAPFRAGKHPITKLSWDLMMKDIAAACKQYAIPVTPKTVLTHAEVQPNLGIKQRGKWDITRLPWDLSIKGARAVGDKLRADVKAAMA